MKIVIDNAIYKEVNRKNIIETLIDIISSKDGFVSLYPSKLLNETRSRVSLQRLKFYLTQHNFCLTGENAIWVECQKGDMKIEIV